MEPQSLAGRLRASLRDLGWASREYHSSRLQILFRLLALYRLHHYRPQPAHHEGLSNPALGPRHLAAVISKRELMALQKRLNRASHEGIASDKALFYIYARGVGLPVPCLYAVVDRHGGWAGDGRVLKSDAEWEALLGGLDGEIIVKPAEGLYGRGVRGYVRVELGFEDQQSGHVYTLPSFARTLLADPAKRLVLQQRLKNHPAIVELTGTETLQTLRIRTLATGSGDVLMGSCFMKIAVGGQVRDNIENGATGNFVAAVGQDDGRLRLPVAYAADGRGVRAVPTHPHSGRTLTGFAVPWWEEAKVLARTAARKFYPLRTLGWDIALTPDCPVLIEANRYWDPGNMLAALPEEQTYPREMAVLLTAMRAEAVRCG